jgi:hypothetical protein
MPSLTSFMVESGGSEWGLSILRVGVGRDAAGRFFSGGFDLFDGRGGAGRARVLGPPASENPY